jgi:hypothetical protein
VLPNPFFFKIIASVFTEEESCPKIWTSSVIKKTAPSKQSPNRRKLAQSGHHVLLFKKTSFQVIHGQRMQQESTATIEDKGEVAFQTGLPDFSKYMIPKQ